MIKVDKLNSGFEFDASAGKFMNSTEGIGCPGQSSTIEVVIFESNNLKSWTQNTAAWFIGWIETLSYRKSTGHVASFFNSWLISDGKLDDNGSSSKNPDIKTPLEKWIETLS